jgi:hypothetical protein
MEEASIVPDLPAGGQAFEPGCHDVLGPVFGQKCGFREPAPGLLHLEKDPDSQGGLPDVDPMEVKVCGAGVKNQVERPSAGQAQDGADRISPEP